MKNAAPRNGRPPDKREQVVRFIRDGIVAGSFMPESRVPTHQELERLCGADSRTIRVAMEVLRADGFIETYPRRGTFVVPHPPHLSHFALTFPATVLKDVSRFYEAIRDEAAKMQAPERRVSTFYDIESHTDVDDYQRLLGFVRARRLAGLIFAGVPYKLAGDGSPLLCEPGVARIAIMLPNDQFAFPSVYPDLDAFLPKAFDYLLSRRLKRVAVIMLAEPSDARLGTVQSLACERGLIVRPHWIQAASAITPEWSRRTALMMFHEGQVERPDAVVITDDNVVEGFTAGIRDSGVRAGANGTGELEVVAQANFPYPTRSHVPAKRLGYDIRRLMSVSLERIAQQRRGETAPAHTAIPAVWEDER